MFVTAHAEDRLVTRIGHGTALSMILARLEAMVGEPGSVAIEVARYLKPRLDRETGANGDQVVVIAREGSVETVMFRRSWNQPFTPAALGVARCQVL